MDGMHAWTWMNGPRFCLDEITECTQILWLEHMVILTWIYGLIVPRSCVGIGMGLCTKFSGEPWMDEWPCTKILYRDWNGALHQISRWTMDGWVTMSKDLVYRDSNGDLHWTSRWTIDGWCMNGHVQRSCVGIGMGICTAILGDALKWWSVLFRDLNDNLHGHR